MSVSIVLRVKNEARMLHDVLQGVERQNYRGDMDVVVVDSGSTDGTLEIARAHNCRIFCIKPEDFSWGYALNLGAEKSTGDFIAYLSGHCVPVMSSGWKICWLRLRTHPSAAFTAGMSPLLR